MSERALRTANFSGYVGDRRVRAKHLPVALLDDEEGTHVAH
jgi:hypothetical protein